MPLIIGRGFGRDDQVIIQQIIGSRIIGTVVAEARIFGTVRVKDEEVPYGTIQEAIQVHGTIVSENLVVGIVESEQVIIGILTEEGPCMSNEANRIVMFIRDNRTLSVSAAYEDGSATDLTGAKMWFTVKQRSSDPDANALISKKNTAAGGGDSEIRVTDAAAGRAEVYIVPDDTENMDPGIYVYDVQVTLADGKTYTIVRDRITLKEDVTKAKV